MLATILKTPDVCDHLSWLIQTAVEEVIAEELSVEETEKRGLGRYEEKLMRYLRDFGPENITEKQRAEITVEIVQSYRNGVCFRYNIKEKNNGSRQME